MNFLCPVYLSPESRRILCQAITLASAILVAWIRVSTSRRLVRRVFKKTLSKRTPYPPRRRIFFIHQKEEIMESSYCSSEITELAKAMLKVQAEVQPALLGVLILQSTPKYTPK